MKGNKTWKEKRGWGQVVTQELRENGKERKIEGVNSVLHGLGRGGAPGIACATRTVPPRIVGC